MSFLILGQILAPNTSISLIWNSTQWVTTGDGTPNGQNGNARKTVDQVVNNSVVLVADPDIKFTF